MNTFKSVLLIVVLSFLTTHIFLARAARASSCGNLLNKSLDADGITKIEESYRKYKSLERLTEKHFAELLVYSEKQLELTVEELNILRSSAEKAIGHIYKEEAYSLVVYSKSLTEKNRKIVLASLVDLRNKNRKIQGPLKKFFKIQEKIDKETKNKLNELNQKKSGDKVQSTYQMTKDLKQFRRSFEKMSYGCRSNIWTEERKVARNAFLKFKLGIGLGSSVVAYSYTNQDKFKEDKKLWAQKLGYELTFSVVSSYISTGIIANPSSSVIVKSGAKYLNARAQGLVDWGLYIKFFGDSEAEAKMRVESIKADKEKMKLIKELSAHLKKEYFYNKYKSQLYEYIKPMLIQSQMSMKIRVKSDKLIDWKELTEKDLERPAVMDALVKASLAKKYEESKGGILSYGTIGADRFAFHAGYGALLLPRDIAVDLYIYHILCMGAMNPKAAFFKALGFYTINRIVFDQLYYFSRKESINQ